MPGPYEPGDGPDAEVPVFVEGAVKDEAVGGLVLKPGAVQKRKKSKSGRPRVHPVRPGVKEKWEVYDVRNNFTFPDGIDTWALNVCSRIRGARKKAGLTFYALSAGTGIDEGALSKLERGHLPLTLPKLRRIAGALGISVASLMDTQVESLEVLPVTRDTWQVVESDEKAILTGFRGLRRKEKRLFLGFMRVMYAARPTREPDVPKDPIISGTR